MNIYHCITFMAPGDKLVIKVPGFVGNPGFLGGTIGNPCHGKYDNAWLNSTQISYPKQTQIQNIRRHLKSLGFLIHDSKSLLILDSSSSIQKQTKAAQQKLSCGPSLSFSFFSFFSFCWTKNTTESIACLSWTSLSHQYTRVKVDVTLTLYWFI